MYKYGGIFLEIDTITLNSFDEFINSNYTFIASKDTNGSIKLDIFMSTPNNCFLKALIDSYKYNKNNKYFSKYLSKCCGENISLNNYKISYTTNHNVNELLFKPNESQYECKCKYESQYKCKCKCEFNNIVCIHLWESSSYINIKYIKDQNTTYWKLYNKIKNKI